MNREKEDKNRINNWLQKLSCLLVFLAMFVYLLMQFRNVMVYFDDYGYYSLSYGVYNPNAGTAFSLGELIDFMQLHYINCNGRILWYFIWLLIYWLGDLALVQIAAAIITTGVLLALWKFISKKETKLTASICVCALFGLFPIEIQQHGTYWWCAYFTYVAPILPLMIFFRIYIKNREHGFTQKQKLLMTGLVLLSAFSQEQLAMSVLFMMVLLLAWDTWEQRNNGFNHVLILTALFSVAVLVFNPGLQNRASAHDAPLLNRVLYSTELVIRLFFSRSMKAFVIMLFVALASISIALFKAEKGWLRTFDVFCSGYACFSVVVYCHEGIQNRLMNVCSDSIKLIAIGVLAVCIILFQIIRFYFARKQFDRLIVFLTAAASVGCLCFVPAFPFRLFLPSWLLLFPLLVDGVTVLEDILKSKMGKLSFLVLVNSVILVFSISNMLEIYLGYANNAETHQYNDMVMRAAAEQEKNGKPIDQIYLKEIPDPMYGCVMVYQEGLQYMKSWMMNYYGLTSDPELYFSTDGKSIKTSDETFVDMGSGVFIKVQKADILSVYSNWAGEELQIGVTCAPIYPNSHIVIDGKAYPTTVGESFISTAIKKTELDQVETIEIAVSGPNVESEIVVHEIPSTP